LQHLGLTYVDHSRSLKNYDFERFGNGFQHHVKHEHNMWNYLFYMMHLKVISLMLLQVMQAMLGLLMEWL